MRWNSSGFSSLHAAAYCAENRRLLSGSITVERIAGIAEHPTWFIVP